ncbi:integrase [Dactylosporangium matsuzakiense]|uniref:integrase n=1 Tax=Dactylosporangium matsuzakiense TaxID=53360 RepID=UPI0021C29234|nr:integrase [Dactylosporangium matsuzakiense]UWZ48038.1 integrase [Dactylosporangium matsuzakiense]
MRTRLRQVHVDGRLYAWRATVNRAGGGRSIRVRAWGEHDGCALQADLLSRTAGPGDGAYPDATDVRALIEHGLRHGWAPDVRGGTFVLSAAEHAERLSLPAFELTDLA